MPKRHFKAALRARRVAVEMARRHLLGTQAAEQAAGAAESAARQAIVREASVAAMVTADDAAVETFAAWLPVGRAAAARLEQALRHACSETSQARAILAAARTAEASIQVLIDSGAAAAKIEANRKEQRALDDAAASRKQQQDRANSNRIVKKAHRRLDRDTCSERAMCLALVGCLAP
jgi:Flagellar FliJ protein